MSGIVNRLREPEARSDRRNPVASPGSLDTRLPTLGGDTTFPPRAADHATEHAPSDAYAEEAADHAATQVEHELTPGSSLPARGGDRDPDVARQNGFQGLIPLDDIRSEYAPADTPLPLTEDPSRLQSDLVSSTADSVHSMSLDDPPVRSSNPSYSSIPNRLRNVANQSPASSTRSDGSSDNRLRQLPERTLSIDGSTMSTQLPDDDGMNMLRAKLHEIRDMALSSEEKAKKMHTLMTADYDKFQSQRTKTQTKQEPDLRRSPPPPLPDVDKEDPGSPASETSEYMDDALLYVMQEDIEPTYNFLPPEDSPKPAFDDEEDDNQPIFGCKHYMRNVKVQCVDCFKWYTCRHCHDEVEDHALIRKNIRNMLCMHCGHAQRASEVCRECGEETANYYCGICKLWDNDAGKSIYHCPDCGICRRGEGLGKDYVHCKKCNVCVSINHAFDHRCVERATECDCPICGEWMFSSSAAVVAMKCGHYIHRTCYDELMKTSYKCPICSRSAVNMELQWRKMDLCLESQPMPEKYRNTKAWVICNDCSMRSCVPFHWLGNKCKMCDSYNTNQTKLIDGPSVEDNEGHDENEEAARAVERAQAEGALPNDLSPDVLPAAAEDARSPSQSLSSVLPPDQTPIAASADAQSPPRDRPHPRSTSDPAPVPPLASERGRTRWPSQPLPVSPHTVSSAVADIDLLTEAANHSTAASTAPTEDGESEDEFGFWGAGLRPSEYMPTMPSMPSMPTIPNMPNMPNMPNLPNGWPTTRFFSNPLLNDQQRPSTSPSADQPTRWALNPTSWRLGSPRFFGTADDSAAVIPDDAETELTREDGEAIPSSWHPSQWRLGSPRFLQGATATSSNETGSNSARGTSTSPSSRAGWPVDPRQWRLGSPKFFGRRDSAVAEEDDDDDTNGGVRVGARGAPGTSPPSLWAMRPGFLGRLGSFSSAARSSGTARDGAHGSDLDDGEGVSDGSEDSFSDRERESGADDNDDHDEDDELDEDVLDLIGHR